MSNIREKTILEYKNEAVLISNKINISINNILKVIDRELDLFNNNYNRDYSLFLIDVVPLLIKFISDLPKINKVNGLYKKKLLINTLNAIVKKNSKKKEQENIIQIINNVVPKIILIAFTNPQYWKKKSKYKYLCKLN